MNFTLLKAGVRCVRCGIREHDLGTFLCTWCHGDDNLGREMTAARKRAPDDYKAQRHFLVHELHWAGGWPIIRESR